MTGRIGRFPNALTVDERERLAEVPAGYREAVRRFVEGGTPMAVKKLKKNQMPFPTCTNCGSYSTDGFLRNGGVLMFAHLSAYQVKLGIQEHYQAAGPALHTYNGRDVVDFTTAGVPSGYCASCTTVIRDLLLSHGFKVGPELVEAGGGMTPEQLRKWQQTTLGTCGHLNPGGDTKESPWCMKVAKHEGPHAAGAAAWEG